MYYVLLCFYQEALLVLFNVCPAKLCKPTLPLQFIRNCSKSASLALTLWAKDLLPSNVTSGGNSLRTNMVVFKTEFLRMKDWIFSPSEALFLNIKLMHYLQHHGYWLCFKYELWINAHFFCFSIYEYNIIFKFLFLLFHIPPSLLHFSYHTLKLHWYTDLLFWCSR